MDRWRYWDAEKVLLGKEVPIIVYTMAKVASTSIYRSIKDQTSLSAFHIHTLDSKKIQNSIKLCKENNLVPDSRNPGALVYEKIKRKEPVKIITSIREPVARNLSAFFEAFKFHTQLSPQNWNGSSPELEEIFYQKMNHEFPIDWFDAEFSRMLGLDIYSIPFQKEERFQIYTHENIEILLLRVDLENKQKEKNINQFIQPDEIVLKNYNLGKDKKYAALYKQFLDEIKLKSNYLDKLLNSKFTQHFYSDKEINQLYDTYTK